MVPLDYVVTLLALISATFKGFPDPWAGKLGALNATQVSAVRSCVHSTKQTKSCSASAVAVTVAISAAASSRDQARAIPLPFFSLKTFGSAWKALDGRRFDCRVTAVAPARVPQASCLTSLSHVR
jgi:hypothetical protein